MIDSTYRLREKADYEDFIIISKEQAMEQLEKADRVLQMLESYLIEQWEKI